MRTSLSAAHSIPDRARSKHFTLLGTALLSFLAGSLLTAPFMHPTEAKADTDRVFELMIYHTEPGKVPALESIARNVSKLQSKHGLNIVGFWVPNDDPAWKDTFIYLIAHPNREAADANWKALHADPEFLPYRKLAEPLIRKTNGDYDVDEIYMRPTDFSAMK